MFPAWLSTIRRFFPGKERIKVIQNIPATPQEVDLNGLFIGLAIRYSGTPLASQTFFLCRLSFLAVLDEMCGKILIYLDSSCNILDIITPLR